MISPSTRVGEERVPVVVVADNLINKDIMLSLIPSPVLCPLDTILLLLD